MMQGQEVGFVTRCKWFFGLKPGQTIHLFAAELRALTDKARQYLVDMFNKAGRPTAMAAASAQPRNNRSGFIGLRKAKQIGQCLEP